MNYIMMNRNNNYNNMLSRTLFEIKEKKLYSTEIFSLNLSNKLDGKKINAQIIEFALSKEYKKKEYSYSRINFYEFLSIKLSPEFECCVGYFNKKIYLYVFSLHNKYIKYITIEKDDFFSLLTDFTKKKYHKVKMMMRNEIHQLIKYQNLSEVKEVKSNHPAYHRANEDFANLENITVFKSDLNTDFSLENEDSYIEKKIMDAQKRLDDCIKASDHLLSFYNHSQQDLNFQYNSIRNNTLEAYNDCIKRRTEDLRKKYEFYDPHLTKPVINTNDDDIKRDIEAHNSKIKMGLMSKIEICKRNIKNVETKKLKLKNAMSEFQDSIKKLQFFKDYPGVDKDDLEKISEIKKILEYKTNSSSEVEQKIIIDGSNVAWFSFRKEKNEKPNYKNIKYVINALKHSGYSDVVLFMDASLKYQVIDKNSFETFLDELDIIHISVPANSNADLFILDYAKKNDAMIITNDQFRDHVNNGIISESLLRELLIKYTIADKTVSMVHQDRGLI